MIKVCASNFYKHLFGKAWPRFTFVSFSSCCPGPHQIILMVPWPHFGHPCLLNIKDVGHFKNMCSLQLTTVKFSLHAYPVTIHEREFPTWTSGDFATWLWKFSHLMWFTVKFSPDVLKQFYLFYFMWIIGIESNRVTALWGSVGDTYLSLQQKALPSIAMTLTVRPSSLFFNECAMESRILVCSGCCCIPLCVSLFSIRPAWHLLSLPGVQSNSLCHKRAGVHELKSTKNCFLKPLSV